MKDGDAVRLEQVVRDVDDARDDGGQLDLVQDGLDHLDEPGRALLRSMAVCICRCAAWQGGDDEEVLRGGAGGGGGARGGGGQRGKRGDACRAATSPCVKACRGGQARRHDRDDALRRGRWGDEGDTYA